MDKFKVGDRVINTSNSVVPIDEIGTVMFTNINGLIGVALVVQRNGRKVSL